MLKNILKLKSIHIMNTIEQKSIAGGSGGFVTSTEKAIDPIVIPTKPLE